MNTLGVGLALLATLQWSMLGVFIKNIENIPINGVVIGRLLIGAFILFFIIIINKKTRVEFIQSFKRTNFYIVMSSIMSLHFIFATIGYSDTTIANASLLTNTTPIFVMFFSIIFLSEVIKQREMIGLFLACMGIVIIFSSQGLSLETDYLKGNLFALLSALLLAIYTIIGKNTIQKYSPLITLFWICLLGAVIIALMTFLNGNTLSVSFIGNDMFNLVGLALVGTFGHLCYFLCLKYIKATNASIITLCSPLIAMIYGSFILLEQYSVTDILGIIICLSGIFLTINIDIRAFYNTVLSYTWIKSLNRRLYIILQALTRSIRRLTIARRRLFRKEGFRYNFSVEKR